jgi:sugar lactone lactonase YvrE
MNSDSDVVRTLKKGDRVYVSFSLEDSDGAWCDVAESDKSAKIGWVRCSQLEWQRVARAASQSSPPPASASPSTGSKAGRNIITTAVGAGRPDENAGFRALEEKIWKDMQEGRFNRADIARLEEERREAFRRAGGKLSDLAVLGAAATRDLVTGGESSEAVLAAIVARMVRSRELGPVGDGGPAILAELDLPVGMAFDREGNLYIADSANRRVRKVSPDGTITTVAGSGIQGYEGDGGPAQKARLMYPKDVAVDAAGNIYIADSLGHAVRIVDRSATIWTYAGDGAKGFAGDGGPPEGAQLNNPLAVEISPNGRLYIADSGNNRVRMITSRNTIVTVAGNGKRESFGDGGPAALAGIVPTDVAFDREGNLYVLDGVAKTVRKVDTNGTVETVAGGGTARPGASSLLSAREAKLQMPGGVAVDGGGDLFIVEYTRVLRVRKDGMIEPVAGGANGYSGDGGPALEAGLVGPKRAIIDSEGNLFISTTGNRVRKVSRVAVGRHH